MPIVDYTCRPKKSNCIKKGLTLVRPYKINVLSSIIFYANLTFTALSPFLPS